MVDGWSARQELNLRPAGSKGAEPFHSFQLTPTNSKSPAKQSSTEVVEHSPLPFFDYRRFRIQFTDKFPDRTRTDHVSLLLARWRGSGASPGSRSSGDQSLLGECEQLIDILPWLRRQICGLISKCDIFQSLLDARV